MQPRIEPVTAEHAKPYLQSQDYGRTASAAPTPLYPQELALTILKAV
jgi:hypothetical protein